MFNADHAFTVADFSLGLDLSSTQTILDKRALRDCKNFNLNPNRGLSKRNGIALKYATAAMAATPVKDLFEYEAPNGTTYILVAIGQYIKSYYGDTWNILKTFATGGKRCQFVKHQGNCYIVNGIDNNTRLYNTTAFNVGIPVPADAPTVASGVAGALSGKYKVKYCYRRSTPNGLTGNPSAASAEVTVDSQKIDVTVVQSSDSQVDKIQIYRTYDLALSDTDPGLYFFVEEVANTSGTYSHDTADADLGMLVEDDNDAPPKAKFSCLYKDRVFYANFPDVTDGKSKIVYSKIGKGDAVPALNYEFFDRGDGEEITGITSLPDFFIAFKKNKMLIISGDFAEKKQIAPLHGIGCVASWAIIQMENRIIFLAEEGWKSTDGISIFDLSLRINEIFRAGYVSINEIENYSAIFYPARQHFQFLINHSVSSLRRVMVGHFLVPLLFIDRGISEQTSENLVGWTYHQYDFHTLTCLARYTDSSGIARIMAGTSDGYIYDLDTGLDDGGYDISFCIESGWLLLGTKESVVHTLRMIVLSYGTSNEDDFTFRITTDFMPDNDETNLRGMNTAFCGACYCGLTYCGIDIGQREEIIYNAVGSRFKYAIYGTTQQDLNIQSLTFCSRIEGVR